MMRENGNIWSGDGRKSSTKAPAVGPVAGHAMMHEIHVLLVDHDSDALIRTAKQLETCQYRVTFVELASAAISMLLSGKAKFDVVMANVNSPDLHGFKLLQHAVTMGIPVVLMSVDDNAFLAMRALENGAFLFIKKPATMEILRCLWQHVVREKVRMARDRGMFLGANIRGFEFRDQVVHQRDLENPNIGDQMSMMKNNCKPKKKKGRNGGNEDEEFELENEMMFPNNVRRKMCTEWTQELHAKFMDAVEQLGEGRCFPKEILELMNVPGLTRMQVASHLQKCRNDNWRSPEERRPNPSSQATSEEGNGSQPKPRRFGSKPLAGKAVKGQGSEPPNSKTETETPNNGAKMGNGSGPSNGTPGANSSSNEFYFPYMDCLIQNLSGGQQGSEMDVKPDPTRGVSEYPAAYNDEQQNSGMETRSQWSSETSNFDSEHSAETKGRDDE